MRTSLPILFLVPGLLTTGAAFAAPKPSCVTVEVSTLSSKAGIPVSKTIDLTFTVLFPAKTPGDHVVELRVFTPDGQLYRAMPVPFTDGTRAATVRKLPGYPRPVAEKVLTSTLRGKVEYSAVAVPFPVAGTDIVSAGIYGRWAVQAHVDGEESPCAAATPFVLIP